jgi:hypothetical protein
MRAPLLCVVGITLWSATAVARQAPPAAALPLGLRAHVEEARFDVVSSINGLSGGVRAELQTLFGSRTLDIVDPGKPFRGDGAAASARLPTRRLVAAGCSREDCLLYYERGGRARTWRVVLFHWTPRATKLEWGGTAPGDLTTFDDVRRAVLSGAIKGSAGPW